MRGDKGAGSKLLSIVGSEELMGLEGGTCILAGAAARVLGESFKIGDEAVGISGCAVAGILGLELGVRDDCENLLVLCKFSEPGSSTGRCTVGSVVPLKLSDIDGREPA
jgi:hypothetical protein